MSDHFIVCPALVCVAARSHPSFSTKLRGPLAQMPPNAGADAPQRHIDLGSIEGLQGWRDMVVAAAMRTKAKGGCPLGSLGGQLAGRDPEARALIAAGFERLTSAPSATGSEPFTLRRANPLGHRPRAAWPSPSSPR